MEEKNCYHLVISSIGIRSLTVPLRPVFMPKWSNKLWYCVKTGQQYWTMKMALRTMSELDRKVMILFWSQSTIIKVLISMILVGTNSTYRCWERTIMWERTNSMEMDTPYTRNLQKQVHKLLRLIEISANMSKISVELNNDCLSLNAVLGCSPYIHLNNSRSKLLEISCSTLFWTFFQVSTDQ